MQFGQVLNCITLLLTKKDEHINYIAILINEKNSIKFDKLFNLDKIAI